MLCPDGLQACILMLLWNLFLVKLKKKEKEKGKKKLRERERKGKGEEVEKVKRKKEYCYLKQQIVSEGKEFGSC